MKKKIPANKIILDISGISLLMFCNMLCDPTPKTILAQSGASPIAQTTTTTSITYRCKNDRLMQASDTPNCEINGQPGLCLKNSQGADDFCKVVENNDK